MKKPYSTQPVTQVSGGTNPSPGAVRLCFCWRKNVSSFSPFNFGGRVVQCPWCAGRCFRSHDTDNVLMYGILLYWGSYVMMVTGNFASRLTRNCLLMYSENVRRSLSMSWRSMVNKAVLCIFVNARTVSRFSFHHSHPQSGLSLFLQRLCLFICFLLYLL